MKRSFVYIRSHWVIRKYLHPCYHIMLLLGITTIMTIKTIEFLLILSYPLLKLLFLIVIIMRCLSCMDTHMYQINISFFSYIIYNKLHHDAVTFSFSISNYQKKYLRFIQTHIKNQTQSTWKIPFIRLANLQQCGKKSAQLLHPSRWKKREVFCVFSFCFVAEKINFLRDFNFRFFLLKTLKDCKKS